MRHSCTDKCNEWELNRSALNQKQKVMLTVLKRTINVITVLYNKHRHLRLLFVNPAYQSQFFFFFFFMDFIPEEKMHMVWH